MWEPEEQRISFKSREQQQTQTNVFDICCFDMFWFVRPTWETWWRLIRQLKI